MSSNHEKVRQGERILLFALSDYVCKELKQTYGAHWWEDGVLDILYDDQKRDLPLAGDWGTLVDSLDMARRCASLTCTGATFFRASCPSTTAPGQRS